MTRPSYRRHDHAVHRESQPGRANLVARSGSDLTPVTASMTSSAGPTSSAVATGTRRGCGLDRAAGSSGRPCAVVLHEAALADPREGWLREQLAGAPEIGPETAELISAWLRAANQCEAGAGRTA